MSITLGSIHEPAVGLVEDGERITVTAAGVAELGPDFEPLPTGAALLDHWRQKLPIGERAVLEVVVAAWPNAADRDLWDRRRRSRRGLRNRQISAKPRSRPESRRAGGSGFP